MKNDGGGRNKLTTFERGLNLMPSMRLGCVSQAPNKIEDPHEQMFPPLRL